MKYFLIKSRFAKTLALGICFTALSSNIVLANEASQPSVLPSELPADAIQVDSRQPMDVNILPAYGPDTPVSNSNILEIKEVHQPVLFPAQDTPAVESTIEPAIELINADISTDVQIISADGSEPALEHENQLIRKDNVVRVQVNGKFLQLDVDPFIENDRTLLPLRGVMESLGAEVKWNQEEQKVKVYTEDITIELVMGEDTAKVTRSIDGELKEESIKLEVPAKLVDNRTFIPGRFVSETLGATVDWDNSLRVMIIETEDISEPIMEEKFETKGSYQIKDDKIVFDFELVNHHNESRNLQFSSGQQFEIIVTDKEDEEVYRYSDGKAFTQALVFKTIDPNESIKWQDEWDMTKEEREKLISGEYSVEINILVISEENDENIKKDQFKTVIQLTI